LAHQRVFLSGQTDWNEAFAVVTARAGVKVWLESQSRWDDLKRYEEMIALEDRFIRMVLETKKELEALYASFEAKSDQPSDIDPEIQATKKQAVFQRFRDRFQHQVRDYPGLSAYEGWMSQPLNNAHLSAVDTYYQWVPTFENLQQTFSDDWEGFFEAVESMDKKYRSDNPSTRS